MNNELYHHGIKGQKWGVRRYQNSDGSLTQAGRKRLMYRNRVKRELKYIDDTNKIVDTLSKEEKRLLGMSKNEKKWIADEERIDRASTIVKTFIEKYGDEPASMLQIYDIGNGKGDIAIATDPRYRKMGITTKNIEKAKKWFNSAKNIYIDELQWNNLMENKRSGEIAEKFGFGDYIDNGKWEYRRIFKEDKRR